MKTKPPYTQPTFIDISAEVYLRQQKAKAWDRKKYWAPDDKFSIFERITMLFACLVFTIATGCAIVMNYEKLQPVWEFINNLPVWSWTLFAFIVFALLMWIAIRIGTKADIADRNESVDLQD